MTVTRDELVELLEHLVRIDSTNPWLIEGAVGEGAVAGAMADWLDGLGLEVELDEVVEGRFNMMARLRGAEPGPTLCINSHTDTVGYAEWGPTALDPRIDGDRMYGRGAADDKAGCAAAMLAVRDLVRSGTRLKGDVLLALVIDEEGVSSGTEHLVAHHTMDYAIVIEPTGLPLAITEHQGFGWIDVVVHGRAAHGSDPDQGIDAIVHMAEVITRLKKLDDTGFGRGADGGSMSGRTVFHTGTIRGGTDYATYPNACVLGIEIGTQPGEHLSDRVQEIEAIFADVKAIYPDFSGEVNVQIDREPFMPREYDALFEAIVASAEPVLGRAPRAAGLNAWGDSGLCSEAGIPTLCYGVDGGNFHAPDEWVSMPEMVAAVEIVEHTIERFCGTAEG